MTLFEEIAENIQKGKVNFVKELVGKAIAEGFTAKQILEDGLMAGMNAIGQKFKNNEVFVPEVLIAARAMNAGTTLLKPLLISEGVSVKGKVIIGTVKGDLHDIGKNLVRMMMEGKGFEVIDLGVDVCAEKFVQALKEHHADIVACSALLTTTMGEMKKVIEAIENAGLRPGVKIMIGGAPVTEAYRREIGADLFSVDAASAAETALAAMA